MTTTLCICGATVALMIAAIIFFPRLTIGRFSIDTYWPIALLGALVLLFSGQADGGELLAALTSQDAINPLKIALLFLSMTVLSVFLDEVGFFGYVAALALSRAGHSQTRLFLVLYAAVSILTVFTSNDIIILTFTPFICYFAHAAKIDPLPYLVAEFVAANTWSMALVIGNPTNVYLAATYGIDFITYLGVMVLPTLAAGLAALLVLWLLFRRRLREPIEPVKIEMRFRDRLLLVIGLLHLGGCTLLLAIGSYLGWDMCSIALFSALSLMVVTTVACLARRRAPRVLLSCLKRAPWPLLPFILSMFVLILALGASGATAAFADLLAKTGEVGWTYGISSALVCNLINNIPMSAFYCSVAGLLSDGVREVGVYAAVIGSNLGALLTPVGALAGIMWTGMLKKQGHRFGYADFLHHCAPVGVAALAAALGVLMLVL
ncbi:MAG: hypothetical protein IJY20_04635 [Clostridia bacterium]|nr:hypothetical protein [Clostridia bacterium]